MYALADPLYAGFEFTVADYESFKGFIVCTEGRTWYLYRSDAGEYFYLNGYTRPEKFVTAPYVGFQGREGFATGRGYIWSRTLGLFPQMGVKELLLGYGPDTFSTVFPQNDVKKYILTDFPYKMIVTRPHSIYLQTTVQMGMPFALALLWLLLHGMYSCLKQGQVGHAALLLTFALCGLFYDSNPVVTPVFMLIIGMTGNMISSADSLSPDRSFLKRIP